MTAIGIGVTNRDVINGWESVPVNKLNRFQRDYYEASKKSEEADARYNLAVDCWINARENGSSVERVDFARYEVDNAWSAVMEMDEEKHQAYIRMNCPHQHTRVSWDDLNERSVEICQDCDAYDVNNEEMK